MAARVFQQTVNVRPFLTTVRIAPVTYPIAPDSNTAPATVPPETAAPTGDTHVPLFDVNKLTVLEGILPFEKIESLITLFFAEMGDHLDRIGSYHADGDFLKLANEAHIIVSTAGNIGGMQLSAASRRLERACRNEHYDSVASLIAVLDTVSQETVVALHGWLRSRRGSHAHPSATGQIVA